ncbi:Hypothetical protein NTJ_13921 [Nesidiocoris tenuis]|uniref:LisH domain-containing protein n=1 Tax=Nesidiocoris tenuis TaxID=355587 RepID=A0ABN7BBA6_9HEMI|nr:Hypothetical protein NTJ_13921 [Nesidiocoris tenuis]
MDITRLLKLLAILFSNVIVNVFSYNIGPLPTSKDKWQRVSVLDQDELHQTLISVEERLRIVDSVRYGINRLEISIERINNKLDSMESRISRLHTQMEAVESRGRLQSVMQMKLDSISQTLISAEMKWDMLPDLVARKLGNSHDRLLLRVNNVENNIETLFDKFQESQKEAAIKFQTDLGSKTTQLVNAIDDIRHKSIHMEHRLNTTAKEQLQHLMNIESKVAKNEQVEMLTSRLDGIHNQLNQTDIAWAQNDSPRINENEKERMVSSLKNELLSESHNFAEKFGNMYNEVSKRLHAIENAMKDHMMETNVTQKETRDKLRQLMRNHKDCEGPRRSFLDIRTEEMKSYIRMNFANLYDKMDGSNRKLTNLQSEFLESCSSSQNLEELEQRMAAVLDKIHHTMDNKSNKIDKQTNDLLTLLKSHSSQSTRTEKMIVNTENMIAKLANEVDQDRKNVHRALTELFGQGETSFIAIQETRRDVERFLKRDLTVGRRLQNLNANSSVSKTDKPTNETDEISRIHSVELHRPDGVIKLLTDGAAGENAKKTTTSKPDTNVEPSITTILGLSHSLNTTDADFEELLKWSPKNSTEDDEDLEDPDSKDGLAKIPNGEAKNDLPDEFVTHIMLDYIKLLRKQMTLEEFLKEANIARTYGSLSEMIKDLRGMDSVPSDFVDELWQYEADKDLDLDDPKRPYTDPAPEHEDDNYDDYEQ